MTNQTDIIGIVKDLQAMKVTFPEDWNQKVVDRDIVLNFPAIASALLIAVETLERIEEDGTTPEYDWAKAALSDISSLPLPL